jgi:hypothetical protein
MNNPTAFIKKSLTDLIELFPEIRVRYEYDSSADVHCIEVIPKQTYYLNENFIDLENNLTDRFIELFPDQNIYFFTDDSIIGINNVDFELVGSKFNNFISIADYDLVIQAEPTFDSKELNIENSISSSIEIFNSVLIQKVEESTVFVGSVNALKSENQNLPFIFNNCFLAA